MKKNGRSPFWWMEISTGPGRVSKTKCGRAVCRSVSQSVSQSVSLCVQGLSSIAPDRRSRSGRLRSQKMRQSAGTAMAVVTWRHVSRVTRHVPPRGPFEKFSNTAAAQTGGRREPKLSGQKGLGLTWVPWGRTAPGVQKCARRAHFCISAFCPLAPTPFELGTPNLAHGGTLTRAIHPRKIFWLSKFRGVKILDFRKIRFWTPRRSKCAGP